MIWAEAENLKQKFVLLTQTALGQKLWLGYIIHLMYGPEGNS